MSPFGGKADIGRTLRTPGNDLFCFAASPPLALAFSEPFTRRFIFALLLLLGLARQEVSVALFLRPLPAACCSVSFAQSAVNGRL